MKRALAIFALFSFFPLAFLPGDVSGQPCSNSIVPPFIASGVLPNILIILDNSNSMDEDFYGNAVGSYSPVSKSVVARQALQNVVNNLQSTANVGVMTYTLPSNTSNNYFIHNAMPFASYDPNSYCANPPPDCVTYCTTGSATSAANCNAPVSATAPGCGAGFTSHIFTATGTNFPDAILSTSVYPFTSDLTSTRATYCNLIYPKTQLWANPANSSDATVYYNQTDPYYATSNQGTLYGYSGSDDDYHSSYSTAQNASNTYEYCNSKTGTSDKWSVYSGSCTKYQFQPTDSDWALGFYNWGQRMPWYYVGPTWFSNTVVNAPQGYLNVSIGALSNSTQYNNVYNIFNPNIDTSNPVLSSTPYLSCTQSNKNQCSYIVNAGNTPTAGTFLTARNYFSGTLNQGGTTYPSPITSTCQKNYIIYVTDGLPDTKENGTQPFDATVMAEVTTELGNLLTGVQQTISGTTVTFPVLTYVLGVGLTTQAKAQLDTMAAAGGTATSAGHAYYGDNATQFIDALNSIVTDLLSRVAAASSISILSEGQSQSGANMLQGVFYPTRLLGNSTINWPGYLYDYWFYNGATYSNIREDTVHDYILELNEDDGLTFTFNTQLGLSVNRYSDPTGSGNPATFVNTVGLDSLTPLWEAGKMLFQTPAASRTIYTPGTSATGLVSFNTSNSTLTTVATSPLGNPSVTPSTLDPCLTGSSNTATLQNLINYVSGTDIATCSTSATANVGGICSSDAGCGGVAGACQACRNRTFGLCSNGTAFNNTPCASNSDCTTSPYTTCTQNVWKLGDIVYSTPQVQTNYSYCYNGTSFNTQACTQNSQCTTGAYTTCQQKQNVIFVGANDGMLHAFQTGVLSTAGLNAANYQITELTGIATSSMGQELWAFIPKNSLPYLRCLAVPPPNSCHLYYNDLAPYITTMNANGVSKTVLIGGMRLGGAAINTTTPATYCFNSSGATNGQACSSVSNCTSWPYKSSCSGECLNSSGVSNGQKCSSVSNCTTSPYNAGCSAGTNYYINAPSDTCSSLSSTTAALCSNTATCYNPTNCTGLSSYYALDITDSQNPILLWEFSHPFLGYTYSGPAVIHRPTSGNPNVSPPTSASGDQYYVMFLSGPTKATDGSSIQDVQAFVLTLNASLGISSVYDVDLGGNTANGFGGRLFTNGLDVDGDGYTDYVFFGYGNSAGGSATGWTGGIGKVFTGSSNPATWTYDITTYSSIARMPVTARITAAQCFNNWYLYAGTGRYFFPQDNYGLAGNLNYLMGIPFTCDQYNHNCTSIASLNSPSTVTTACLPANAATLATSLEQGWTYTLNAAAGSYLNERLVTDPTVSTGTNSMYFTTSEPTSDPCGYGGQSRVWGLNCATGEPIAQACGSYTVTNLTGTLYLQTSTGAIYQIDAASSFTDTTTGNRTTPWFVGMPPENSPPVVQPATSTAKGGQLIQWIEK
ncbi:MAG: hypothetical protein ABSF52_06170 [Syntrophobacteraceae bacterium]|jgi:Tfp pilus tip-associated adhesin PilY1